MGDKSFISRRLRDAIDYLKDGGRQATVTDWPMRQRMSVVVLG